MTKSALLILAAAGLSAQEIRLEVPQTPVIGEQWDAQGLTTYELAGIEQSAPDRALFQVPPGYRFLPAAQANRDSSLDHYRRAESYFEERHYQPAANEFREALAGDLEPRWIEVWSHINLGKIFDITGQRERAINEYRLAIRTKDDTNGAQAEANKYLKTPYQR